MMISSEKSQDALDPLVAFSLLELTELNVRIFAKNNEFLLNALINSGQIYVILKVLYDLVPVLVSARCPVESEEQFVKTLLFVMKHDQQVV
jgi:hypothetical protein